jgi:two-component system, LytTR family, sensor kinase
MSDLNKRKENLLRFEFWAVTTLYVFFLFFWLVENLGGNNRYHDTYKQLFDESGLSFNYYLDLFLPTLIDYLSWYAMFWVLNFYLVPKIVLKEKIIKNLVLTGLVFLGVAAIDLLTDTVRLAYLYAKSSDDTATTFHIMRNVAMETFQFGVLIGIYTILKYTALYFIGNRKTTERKYRTVQRNGTDALVLWLMSMFILFIGEAERGVLVGWGLIGPLAILLYLYSSYSLIPIALKKNRPKLQYMIRIILLMVVVFFPLFLFAMLNLQDEDYAFGLSALNVMIQVFVSAPLSWVLYKRHMKGKEERDLLERELTYSTANLDFLRSQINPHFLFNALNTIYGTAIMEKAERTSEGIEKLSDMMRFMLQENMQEKIALTKEINYLVNYIDFQRLRTDSQSTVEIQTDIQNEEEGNLQIAPMLLIPFVENAFKHGISLRKTSRISVSLKVQEQFLYFDVFNTMQEKNENDPEKYKSGIGLENVGQRLKLLYPNKHELTIRETGKDFFVHLTLQLT